MLNRRRGFSLLEAMIGMFILMLFVMMTNAYMATFLKTKQSVKQLSRATTIGNDLIEKIRNTPFNQIDNGKDTVENTYVRTWVLDSAVTDTLKKGINLTVQWPLSTRKHSVNLSTIVAQ
jgi:Tfp pilus assembly protein PilV